MPKQPSLRQTLLSGARQALRLVMSGKSRSGNDGFRMSTAKRVKLWCEMYGHATEAQVRRFALANEDAIRQMLPPNFEKRFEQQLLGELTDSSIN